MTTWLLLLLLACPVAQGSHPSNAGTHWMASLYHQQEFPTEAKAVENKEPLLSFYRTQYPVCQARALIVRITTPLPSWRPNR